MKDKNRLRLQLEDLFSDIALPEPQAAPEESSSSTPSSAPPESGNVPVPAEREPDAPARVSAAQPERAAHAPGTPLAPHLPLGAADHLRRAPTQVAAQTASEDVVKVGPGRRSGLRRTLILAFLAAAILPTLAVTLFGGLSQVSRIRSSVTNNLSLITTLQENRVEQWINTQLAAFASILSEPSFERELRVFMTHGADESAYEPAHLATNSRLRTFLVQYPDFFEIFVLDTSGQVLLSTDKVHEKSAEANAAFFIHGLIQPHYQPPAIIERWNKVGLVTAIPIRHITGETLGVLVGLLDPLPSLQMMEETPGLGKTGEAYLINPSGLLLTPLRGTSPAPGDHVSSFGVTEILAEKSGQGVYNNYAGQSVIGVYRWLPNLQIGILAEQKVTEVYSSLIATLGGIAAVALISMVLASVFAGQIARRIASPIIQMTESAHQIMAGDLNQAVPITRSDEVGALGQAFNHMAQQLRSTIAGLEEKVQERTQALQQANFQFQKRAIQLEASSQVSRAAASILDPHELMQTTVDLIRDRFGFYHVSIFLLDEAKKWAVVRASTGEVGRQMVAKPHRLAVGGESMVGWVCATRQPRTALDVGADAVHFDNPLLPYTRSEMALPLRIGDQLLGALDVQSTQEAAFDNDDVRTLQGMADLVAVALENARLFTETRQSMRRQHLLTQVTERSQHSARISEVLAVTISDLGRAFDLEQATICLGTERELISVGNGHEQARRKSE